MGANFPVTMIQECQLTASKICDLVHDGVKVFLANPTEDYGLANHAIEASYDDDYYEAIYCRLPTWYVMTVWVVQESDGDES